MAAEHGRPAEPPLHAVAAEFADPEALLAAVERLMPRGFGRLDALSPVPIAGMSEALAMGRSTLAAFAAVAVVLGFAGSMALYVYATAYDYVFDIGGRPRVSWPAFVVPSLSAALMFGALVVYLVMLFLNRLPRLNHPAFNIPNVERVTRDRYVLVVEPGATPIDPEAIEAALADLSRQPLAVSRVQR